MINKKAGIMGSKLIRVLLAIALFLAVAFFYYLITQDILKIDFGFLGP